MCSELHCRTASRVNDANVTVGSPWMLPRLRHIQTELMQKFVLVDHSLKDLGGHYYRYASCVLAAAERAGFQPVLATHRDFHEFDALPRTWTAHAVFRDKSHSHRMLDAAAAPRGILAQWWQGMRSAR